MFWNGNEIYCVSGKVTYFTSEIWELSIALTVVDASLLPNFNIELGLFATGLMTSVPIIATGLMISVPMINDYFLVTYLAVADISRPAS